MKLKVLGSSSKGNCYLLDSGNECLVLECGISFKEVQKAVDFKISRIVGALISHEHCDHSKFARKFIDAQIPLYMSAGTMNALNLTENRKICPMVECGIYHIHNFTVQPFHTEHDATEPFGFLIFHPDMGTTLFATDTYYLQYAFAGLNNILIECNYDPNILRENINAGRIPQQVWKRTIKSHCSIDTCRETLRANNLTGVNNIVLIHLSESNADPEQFKATIQEDTMKTVHVAMPGLVIDNFNKSPF